MIRVIADTGNARQHWDHRSDELPYLMVPMSDGSVIRYNPEIPHPGFVKAMENIKNICVGYEPGGMLNDKEDNNESTL